MDSHFGPSPFVPDFLLLENVRWRPFLIGSRCHSLQLEWFALGEQGHVRSVASARGFVRSIRAAAADCLVSWVGRCPRFSGENSTFILLYVSLTFTAFHYCRLWSKEALPLYFIFVAVLSSRNVLILDFSLYLYQVFLHCLCPFFIHRLTLFFSHSLFFFKCWQSLHN